jgi:hypothetical protein
MKSVPLIAVPSPRSSRMREAQFTIHQRPDGSLVGKNAALGLVVCASDRESLQEEARDALIRAIGPAHVSYRVRLLSSTAVRNRARVANTH